MTTDPSRPVDQAVCVVWHSGEGGVPQPLRDALHRRQVQTVEVSGPYAAVAELCGLRREVDGRRGLVLLLVEPASLPMVEAVARVVERYVPSAVLWQYAREPGEQEPSLTVFDVRALRRAVRHDPVEVPASAGRDTARSDRTGESAGRAAVGSPEWVAASSRPALRLTGQVGFQQGAKPADVEDVRPAGPASLLSEEELALLLGDEPTGRRGRE